MRLSVKTLQNGVIAIVTVFQAAVDAADGGGGKPRFLGDIGLDIVFGKHFCGMEAAGHLLQLGGGAKILQKAKALLGCLQSQKAVTQIFQQLVRSVRIHKTLLCALWGSGIAHYPILIIIVAHILWKVNRFFVFS